MVKMSHSNRKRLVPSKVKVKDTHMSDVNMETDSHGPSTGSGRSKNGDGKFGECSGDIPAPVEWLGYHPIGIKKEPQPSSTNNNVYSNGKHDFREQSSPLSLSDRSTVNHEPGQDETSSNGNKDDEDDDDDESEDKIDTQQHDPERLKAFNMFVRLFVDENLDRMVPISKQPKEKIQAIIDSCTRQFPEFAERARKRIRTYLKSCRRNKRSRDSNGWESSRPTPAHLTSVQAEQILAQACENESQNAKRMRMGLEPVGQPLPSSRDAECRANENGHHGSGSSNSSGEKRSKSSKAESERDKERERERERGDRERDRERGDRSDRGGDRDQSSITGNNSTVSSSCSSSGPSSGSASATPNALESVNNQNLNLSLNGALSIGSNENLLNQLPSAVMSKAMERSPLIDYSRALNGNGLPNMSMYRPNFGQPFSRPTPFPTLFPSSGTGFPHSVSPIPSSNDAGPTDLSMKTNKPLLAHKLNATEIVTVRQLITGYRESAAFLLRSADELEQLLIQQQQLQP